MEKMKKEPKDQYGMSIFKAMEWGPPANELTSDNTERSIKFRRRTYEILNTIHPDELKEFSKMMLMISLEQGAKFFNLITLFVSIFDEVIDRIYPEKDSLEKLDISDLNKLKNWFEELLSIKIIVSKTLSQLLIDYKNDKNSIKTNNSTTLQSHVTKIQKQIEEKENEAKKLKNDLLSIKTLWVVY
ncbi:virulence associated lipoprotein [Borreliella turdi]|uniref:virulence associated lipoprotein n=1 Tax=Borreliella turdi TaxID=57863 RepID=UPI003435F329